MLLLVIWLSVENIFSTEPIVAFLDLHLGVNKNVDGCFKSVYNIDISHRYTPVSNHIIFLRYR